MPCNKKATFTCALVSALVLILAPVRQIQGFPNGAPPTACATMTPGHGVDGQQSASPFMTQLLDGEIVLMDGTVRLELRPQNGVNSFKGFLVMAFDKADESKPIGTFKQPIDGKVIDCSAGVMNAVTHTNNLEKKSVTLDWTPPKNFMGQVIFRTTYVENKSTFWVKTESKAVAVVLEIPSATTTTTMAPQTQTTTTAAPVSTTPMSVSTMSAPTQHHDHADHAGDHDHPTTTASSPKNAASQSSSFWIGLIAMSVLSSLLR
ncbi:putative defense protein 3 isoform X2 [Daphnia carinata]|uniref:putative defense protein 3 isoform X2 n=1 Tax=Daphnia carinata TaxID=120202 RepID=UPI0025808670|nr:putative defense protein 3 isoform X2 [Daphnia carinata]